MKLFRTRAISAIVVTACVLAVIVYLSTASGPDGKSAGPGLTGRDASVNAELDVEYARTGDGGASSGRRTPTDVGHGHGVEAEVVVWFVEPQEPERVQAVLQTHVDGALLEGAQPSASWVPLAAMTLESAPSAVFRSGESWMFTPTPWARIELNAGAVALESEWLRLGGAFQAADRVRQALYARTIARAVEGLESGGSVSPPRGLTMGGGLDADSLVMHLREGWSPRSVVDGGTVAWSQVSPRLPYRIYFSADCPLVPVPDPAGDVFVDMPNGGVAVDHGNDPPPGGGGVIELGPGESRTIRTTRRKLFTISGSVDATRGHESARVVLVARRSTQTGAGKRIQRVEVVERRDIPAGETEFQFSDLQPGNYALLASQWTSRERVRCYDQLVEVIDRDIEGVLLEPKADCSIMLMFGAGPVDPEGPDRRVPVRIVLNHRSEASRHGTNTGLSWELGAGPLTIEGLDCGPYGVDVIVDPTIDRSWREELTIDTSHQISVDVISGLATPVDCSFPLRGTSDR